MFDIEKTLRVCFTLPIGYVAIGLLCSPNNGNLYGQRNASGPCLERLESSGIRYGKNALWDTAISMFVRPYPIMQFGKKNVGKKV